MLAPGERVRNKGLIFAATPASDFICGTLQLAAGMTLQVFTTGRGTPYGLAMAPVMIDLDAGRIATGQATIAEIGWEIFKMILDVGSGRKRVAADRFSLHNSLVLFNPAPVT